MRYIGFMILIGIISILAIGQVLYEEHGEDYDIYNVTSQLEWNSSCCEIKEINYSQGLSPGEVNGIRINNMVNKFIDFIGFLIFEVTKISIEWGFEHPDFDYKEWVTWIPTVIIVVIIIMIIPVVLPLCAIVYLAYVGIKTIWIKIREYIRKRREGCKTRKRVGRRKNE